MNICIDQGNSKLKMAVFDNGHLVTDHLCRSNPLELFNELCSLYPIEKAIYCSVSGYDEALERCIKENVAHYVRMNIALKLPIQNDYATPQTLGLDRVAAAVGAYALSPDQNLLIVDAGSAITYDFVNKEGHFLGGNIAPGLKMRLRALHDYTAALPLVNVPEEPLPTFGTSTQQAIAAGVVNGIRYEMNGYIQELTAKYGHICIFLTGGNLSYFHNHLNMTTFAEKNLVMYGLNRILEYNA